MKKQLDIFDILTDLKYSNSEYVKTINKVLSENKIDSNILTLQYKQYFETDRKYCQIIYKFYNNMSIMQKVIDQIKNELIKYNTECYIGYDKNNLIYIIIFLNQ